METPEAPAWGSRRCPPRLRGPPSILGLPGPFLHPDPPLRLRPRRPPPAGWRLLPPGPEAPPTRPAPVFSPSFSLPRAPPELRWTAGRQPGRGSWGRNHPGEDAVARPAAPRRRLAPAGSQAQRGVCQALPGASPVRWRLLGSRRGKTGLASAAASVATNTHATSHTRTQCVSRNGERGALESVGRGHLKRKRFQL